MITSLSQQKYLFIEVYQKPRCKIDSCCKHILYKMWDPRYLRLREILQKKKIFRTVKLYNLYYWFPCRCQHRLFNPVPFLQKVRGWEIKSSEEMELQLQTVHLMATTAKIIEHIVISPNASYGTDQNQM